MQVVSVDMYSPWQNNPAHNTIYYQFFFTKLRKTWCLNRIGFLENTLSSLEHFFVQRKFSRFDLLAKTCNSCRSLAQKNNPAALGRPVFRLNPSEIHPHWDGWRLSGAGDRANIPLPLELLLLASLPQPPSPLPPGRMVQGSRPAFKQPADQ